ncbi:MAG: SDR family oxidoreductase [Patescibacteria group bacterium]
MNLKGKIAVIIGATGGIGSEISNKLQSEGARLILVGRNNIKLNKSLASSHQFFEVNISDPIQIHAFSQKLTDQLDKIDFLINAAGIGLYKSLADTTYDDWQSSIAINVTAPFIFIKDLLPLLQKTSDSIVLTIGSGAGVIPMKGRSMYCASKFALRGFILSLAEEFAGRSPRFCLITLGSTLTDFAGTSVEKKKEEYKKGRAYFTPEWVANKLVEIVKKDYRETEYTLYPGDFGFGTWKKP